MTAATLSVNKAFAAVCAVLTALSVIMAAVLYLLTGSSIAVWIGALFSVCTVICVIFFLCYLRKKLTVFSDSIGVLMDNMMNGEDASGLEVEEESIFYKISHRLVRLYEVMCENRRSVAKEKSDLQELVSDISHQVKTPISNLKMINAALLERQLEGWQQEFILASQDELDKLDFLMQAMIKTSRLETRVISLIKKNQPIYGTLASALGGILLNAEQKNITVVVDCDENTEASHDSKWTGEAIFNILDNAVKYTLDGGSVHIAVKNWDMYVKIDITDTGKGILEHNYTKIFKRFYREEDVHQVPGIGIGLYLAREIITMQAGYIKVSSKYGEGSTFSVFLPRTQPT